MDIDIDRDREVERLKMRLSIPDSDFKQDDYLTMLLEDAESEILDFTNRDTLTPRLIPLCRELAIVYYNRQGTEGESSRSEGGISISYVTDIPESIKSRLTSHRLLKGARIANATK